MRQRNKEAGNILLLTGLALTVLMGFAGLAVDMGMLRYDKRLQQTAADAAAIAGASNLAYTGWQAGGQNAAAANGFTDSSGNTLATCTGAAIGTVCVEIDSPPVDGPHANQAGCPPNPSCYVEARVSEIWPTFFMNLLNIPSEQMTARAVATSLSNGSQGGGGCAYTLGSPAKGVGININGHPTLVAPDCGIVDNGNFTTKGNALTVNAGTFSVSGSWFDSGTQGSDVTCTTTQSSNPPDCFNNTGNIGAPAGPNPFANLTPPCNPCTGGSSPPGPNFTHGTYSSITITGNATVTFAPGIYIFTGGGISCSGTPPITGTGVMFYFANNSTYNCQGNDNVTLTAPTASNCPSCPTQYDGILMYQQSGNTNGPSIGGNVGSQFNGALYFPTSDVTFYGNSNTSVCTDPSQVTSVGMVVSESLDFSGNPTVCLEGPVGLQNQGITVSTVATAILVE
jgi:Flp pilus assembly protein TadG